MDATPEQLNGLFPAPAANLPTPVVKAPIRHAGLSPESTEAVLVNLKENHQRWHIFFNEKHFHKYVLMGALVINCTNIICSHAAHHLLAIYAMGGNAELLNAVYRSHETYQKPAFPPPDEEEMKRIQAARKAVIDESNWKEHLGDERYVN